MGRDQGVFGSPSFVRETSKGASPVFESIYNFKRHTVVEAHPLRNCRLDNVQCSIILHWYLLRVLQYPRSTDSHVKVDLSVRLGRDGVPEQNGTKHHAQGDLCKMTQTLQGGRANVNVIVSWSVTSYF